MKAPKRFYYFIPICLAASILSSCSRIKLAYGMGGLLLERQAHQYLELDPRADARLKSDITAYMAWHRKDMLPVYASLCRKIAQGFSGSEPEADNIRLVTPMLAGVWSDTVEPMIAPVAQALWSLDSKGIDHLEAAYANDSKKQRHLYMESPAAADKRRVQKTQGLVEGFAGPLSPQQAKRLAEITLAVRMPYEDWVTDRELRKRDMIALLRQHQSRLLVEGALRDWWLRSRISGARVERGQMDGAQVRQFFLNITDLLNPQQREHAAKTLEAYAADFDGLSGEPPGPQPRPLVP